MQRSFSIVDDDFSNESAEEEMVEAKSSDLKDLKSATPFNLSNRSNIELNDSTSEEGSPTNKKAQIPLEPPLPVAETSHENPGVSRQLNPKPADLLSGRQTVLKAKAPEFKIKDSSSESDGDDTDDGKKPPAPIPGEYDYKVYENLEVDSDVKEIFQYIIKYTPQHLNLDYKFRPFIPEFLPAVGDIDAFLKVIPPTATVSGETFNVDQLQLGLIVLDEPAANQSDPALLHLQLRAASNLTHSNHDANVVVKKIDNVEKNAKVIDKWIKDISDLHKSKSSPVVKYSEPMPDLDDLMQEWPEEVENHLKDQGFPFPDSDTSLTEYIDTVCGMFEIPIAKNKIESLHLLFCLYAAVKNSQLYQQACNANVDKELAKEVKREDADQLVLD